MIVDIFNVDELSHNKVGGKAYNLHKLHRGELPVPRAIVIPPHTIESGELSDALDEIEWIRGSSGLFAVRSSGIGEDSQDKSWAGIFDSFLYIEAGSVALHVRKVIDSMNTDRYSKYSSESGIEIAGMAVIVQEMIDADYAGVAFTASPIENDSRVALIEVVKGVGESLVSSKKTPATLRVNKVTGSMRIQQSGEDRLEESILQCVCDKLSSYLSKIEELYGRPMDVEWAICDERVYILQARPITTI